MRVLHEGNSELPKRMIVGHLFAKRGGWDGEVGFDDRRI